MTATAYAAIPSAPAKPRPSEVVPLTPTALASSPHKPATHLAISSRRGAIAGCGATIVRSTETGRQPVDNPDTHLELTMIHEGPLLEYAGRDLALLQWSAAVRHWLVLVLLATILLPHPVDEWGSLALLPIAVVFGCDALAVTETLVAKIRIYRAPRMLAIGIAVALLATAAHALGGTP